MSDDIMSMISDIKISKKTNNYLKEIKKREIEKKKQQIQFNPNYCNKCKESSIIQDNGSLICSKCGLYYNKVINTDEVVNYADNNVDSSRTIMVENHLMPNSNKGSIYGYSKLKSNKKSDNYHHHNMIRTRNIWNIMNYKDNNMLKRFNNITSICTNAGMNNLIIETAKEVFYKIQNIHSPRRDKLKALMASSVIISCKQNNNSYNFDQIAYMFNISKKILRNMLNEYEHYWKEICDKEELKQIKLASESLSDKNGEIVIEKVYCQFNNNETHNDFKFYFNMLELDEKYLAKINALDKWINDKQILIEHVPKSIIACLIYTICKLYDIKNIKKSKIANVCNTSIITINKCYNKLENYQDDIIQYLNSC